MKGIILLSLFLIFLPTHDSFADRTRTLSGNWDNFRVTVHDNQPLLFYFKTENRFYKQDPIFDLFLMRPALGYGISKKLSLWLGYDFFQYYNNSRRIRQAFWLQGQFKALNSKSFNLVSRSRLEDRFATFGPGDAIRFRERLYFTLYSIMQSKLRAVAYEEIFLNLNHPVWVSKKTISQNRAFVGAGIPLNKTVVLLMGYLNRVRYYDVVTYQENLFKIEIQVDV